MANIPQMESLDRQQTHELLTALGEFRQELVAVLAHLGVADAALDA